MLLMFLSTSGLIPLTVSAVLLSGFLFPWLTVMAEAWKWRLPGALLLLALALMAVAAGRSGYDVRHPRATGLFYYLDGDKGEAFFVSTDRDVNSWTKSFLQNGLERTNLRRFTPLDAPALASRAPLAQIEAPVLSVMQDVCLGDLRILQLRAAPALRARALWISADRCRVLAATVGGKEIARPPSASDETGWGLYYVGLPENGPILSLVVRRTDNPVIRIVAQFDGFPAFVETSFPPRPDYFMPSPTLMFDSATLVSRTHPIPAVRP
jgi:hypothetical protein